MRLPQSCRRQLTSSGLPNLPAAPPTSSEARAFDALTTLLRTLAGRHPVLLLVDDLQYAGRSTVELLHFLGRRLGGARLLIVITVRTESSADVAAALEPVATPLEVGPLDETAVAQLANDAGQGSFAADILHRTRGHPLFVVEVLRALRGGEDGRALLVARGCGVTRTPRWRTGRDGATRGCRDR